MARLPRLLVAPLLVATLLLQWWVFSRFVEHEVAPDYPRHYDQLASLTVSYEGYEQARAEGVVPALRHALRRDHPMGLLMPVAGVLTFTAFGPSRLHALALNFAAYALLQVVVVLVLRRLAGWPAALLGWGLTWALRTVYQPAGGIADFRADFPALCLFTAFLGVALRGGVFASTRWSVLAGLVAAACVWARFLTIVYLAAMLAAFAAAMLARRRWAAAAEERQAAGARGRGAVVAGLLMAGLSAPALWAQREGIAAHYFRGILGPMRAVRAQVVGADHPLGNLVFYPQSLLGHAGLLVLALALAAAAGLAVAAVRRRSAAIGGPASSAAALLLALAFVVPLVVLTVLTSKAFVVGGILTAPLLWAIPLAAARGWRAWVPRAGWPGEAGALAAAALVALAGAVVQLEAWGMRSRPGQRPDVAGVFALHDAIERDSRERGWSEPIVSVDHVSDGVHAWALNVTTYERKGRILRARLGLGSGIGPVDEADALAAARASDFVILTARGSPARGVFPADLSLEAARPALLADCERAMRFRGRFQAPGREVLLFSR